VPLFSDYILKQNAAIDSGSLQATKINLVAIAVNGGIFNAPIWFRSMIDYSVNNPYKVLANESLVAQFTNYYDTQCKPQLDHCYGGGTNEECYRSHITCQSLITMVSAANNNSYSRSDIRQPMDGIVPPETYMNYLYRADIQQAIGARVNYTFRSNDVIVNITSTGDCKSESTVSENVLAIYS
jgi:hypothetical protein